MLVERRTGQLKKAFAPSPIDPGSLLSEVKLVEVTKLDAILVGLEAEYELVTIVVTYSIISRAVLT